MGRLLIPTGFETHLGQYPKSKSPTEAQKNLEKIVESIKVLARIVEQIDRETLDKILDGQRVGVLIKKPSLISSAFAIEKHILQLINSIDSLSTAPLTDHTDTVANVWLMRLLFDIVTDAFTTQSSPESKGENSFFAVLIQDQRIATGLTQLVQAICQKLNEQDHSAEIEEILYAKSTAIKPSAPRTKQEIKQIYTEYTQKREQIDEHKQKFLTQYSINQETSEARKAINEIDKTELTLDNIDDHLAKLKSIKQTQRLAMHKSQAFLNELRLSTQGSSPILLQIKETSSHKKVLQQLDIIEEITLYSMTAQEDIGFSFNSTADTLSFYIATLSFYKLYLTHFNREIQPEILALKTTLSELNKDTGLFTCTLIRKIQTGLKKINPLQVAELTLDTTPEIEQLQGELIQEGQGNAKLRYQHYLTKTHIALKEQADKLMKQKQADMNTFAITSFDTRTRNEMNQRMQNRNTTYEGFSDVFSGNIDSQAFDRFVQQHQHSDERMKKKTDKQTLLKNKFSSKEQEYNQSTKLLTQLHTQIEQAEAKQVWQEVSDFIEHNTKKLQQLLGQTNFAEIKQSIASLNSYRLVSWTRSFYQSSATPNQCKNLIIQTQLALKKRYDDQCSQITQRINELEQEWLKFESDLPTQYRKHKLGNLRTYLDIDEDKSPESAEDEIESFQRHYQQVLELNNLNQQLEQISQELDNVDYDQYQKNLKDGKVDDAYELYQHINYYKKTKHVLKSFESQLAKLSPEKKGESTLQNFFHDETVQRIALIRLRIYELHEKNLEVEKIRRTVFDEENEHSKKKYKLLQNTLELLRNWGDFFRKSNAYEGDTQKYYPSDRYHANPFENKNLQGIRVDGIKLSVMLATNLNLRNANISNWDFSSAKTYYLDLRGATLTNCTFGAVIIPESHFYGIKIDKETSMDWEKYGPDILRSNLTNLETDHKGNPYLKNDYLVPLCKTVISKHPSIITGELLLDLINRVGYQTTRWPETEAQFLIRQKQRAREILHWLLPHCHDIKALAAIHTLLDQNECYLRKERHAFRLYQYGNTNTWNFVVSRIQQRIEQLTRNLHEGTLDRDENTHINKVLETNPGRDFFFLFRRSTNHSKNDATLNSKQSSLSLK